MNRVRWAVLTLSALGVAACDQRAPPIATVTDSAGVTITLSRDQVTSFADVTAQPTLSLGGPDATGPTQFFRVQNVHVDANGRLWVADGQSSELRVFLRDGTPWKTLGGRGQGPGEFMAIRLLGTRSADSVFVADDADGRIAVYGPDGRLIRTQRIVPGDNPTPRLFGVFPDGSVLGQVPRILSAAELAPDLILRDSVDLVRVDADRQDWLPYGGALGPLFIWTGATMVPVPFTTNASFRIWGDDEVHLVGGPEFRIRVYDGGHLQESYGVDRPPRRVDGSDIEAYRLLVLGGALDEPPDERQRAYLEALDNEARPEVLPAYARLLVSPGGNVWAQRYESDLAAAPTWDVFAPDRRLIGHVTTPANLIVMAVTPNAIVGV